MNWTRDHQAATCSKCHKTIKPGKLLGQEGRFSYCYRCGTNLELVQARRINRELTMPRF